jgi:signal transduction histidine kinase
MNTLSFIKRTLTLCAVALALSAPAAAADKGTAAEAEAMVAKTVAYIKQVGPEKAYNEITNGTMFKDRDLYAFVYDMQGKSLAHGANAKLVGKELMNMKDPDGNLPNKILIDVAKEKGKGWGSEVKFMNPTSQKIERRKVYVERLGDTVVACGIFLD